MIMELLERKSPARCRACGTKDQKVRVGRKPHTSEIILPPNDVRPFVVGLGVSVVLAGREELR